MLVLVWAGVSLLAAMQPAKAATLALSYEQTEANGITGSGTVTALNVPSTNTYGNSFSSPQTSPIPGSPGAGYGFYNDYLFSITDASVTSITSSISRGDWMVGITNLSVRLYSAENNPTLPVLGAPNGGVISAWSSSINQAQGQTGSIVVIPNTVLALGTYVLEVRGTATGEFGGAYTGRLNVHPTEATPVPLPGALVLMLGGIGLFGGVLRRGAAA